MHGDKPVNNPLIADLNHILAHTEILWEELRNGRIFITGGTGFFGCWLLESFAWANDRLSLNAGAIVLSRNPESFEKRAPHLYHHKSIQFHRGDICTFDFPEGNFSHLIHAAVYSEDAVGDVNSHKMVDEMLQGARRVFEFCVEAKVRKALLVSTGAVYGPIPPSDDKISEDFPGSTDPANSENAYHHLRRMMECLGALHASRFCTEVKIARCFTFIGPYLPLNGRFAAADFIKDSLMKCPLTVKGDGKALRSYLYAADLAIWLWTILFMGKSCHPYNVGSELPITVHGLAQMIALQSSPCLDVSVLGEYSHGAAQNRYVPCTKRALSDMSLRQWISLEEAIQKTMQWYRQHYK